MPAAAISGPSVPTPQRSLRQWTVVGLAVALGAALCCRALLGETYEPLEAGFLDPKLADLGPTPISAALLDTWILLLTGGVFAFSDIRATRLGVVVGAAIAALGAALVISANAAANPRLACLAGANIWITAVAGVALALAARDPLVYRFLFAALLATGVTIATKCLLQHFVEAADTLAAWQDQKAELLKRGVPLDDPQIINYERRVMSLAHESMGYHYHANVTASCLLLSLLPALGILAASIWRDAARSPSPDAPFAREWPILTAVVAALCGAGLYLTGSTGGILSALFALPLLVVLGRCAAYFGRRPLLIVLGGAAIYAGAIALGVLYGVTYHTLPISSLAFRWQYWTAAIPAWLTAPWTGIGLLNFADAYLRFKSAAAVEEVHDPHNLWVALLVETGPLGLIAAILLLGCVAYAAVASWRRLSESVADKPRSISATGESIGASLRVAVFGIAIFATTHAFAGGVVDANAIGIWAFEVLFIWIAGLAAGYLALGPLISAGFVSRWLHASLLAAIAAFLIHELINFAMLTPAGIGVFAMAAALVSSNIDLSAQNNVPVSSRRMYRAGVIACTVLLVLEQFGANVSWSYSASAFLRSFRDYAPKGLIENLQIGLEELRLSSSDPEMPRLAGDVLMRRAAGEPSASDRLATLELASKALELSIRRNPNSEKSHRRLAVGQEETALALQSLNRNADANAALRAAVAEWRLAIELSPTNPRTRIAAARAMLALRDQVGDPALADEIRDQLRRAREIDECRPVGDTIRLTDKELREISDMLKRLDGAPASRPAP